MLVVDHNTISVQWHIGDPVRPMEYSGEVVVVFDPSKTNMAMLIGTPDKQILNIIEFSGNNRKRGPVMDTTLYCQEVRSFLEVYLSKVKLYCVAVEQALTYKGVEYHTSNMVLTEIRSNILNFFLEHFGLKVHEINNWAWKAGVLPQGYRGKYEKGSKKWFVDAMPDSPFSKYFEADATDVICIYWYVVDTKCQQYTTYCNQYEQCDVEYFYYYTPLSNTFTDNMRSVTYNPRFSIQENLDYYVNRIMGQFYMVIPVEKIEIQDVYKKSVGFTLDDLTAYEVKVVASRK